MLHVNLFRAVRASSFDELHAAAVDRQSLIWAIGQQCYNPGMGPVLSPKLFKLMPNLFSKAK